MTPWYWNRWKGETVAILASGPSVTQEDINYLQGKCRVITVNTTFKNAPWADVHYSNDDDWLDLYMSQLVAGAAEIWTGFPSYSSPLVHVCPFDKNLSRISFKPGVMCWGGNSGFAAIGLAVQFGAGRILLYGFDHDWDGDISHHHGHHPEGLQNKKPGFHRWTPYHVRASHDLPAAGVEIYNCSVRSALECYPKKNLREVLCCSS